MNTMCKTLIILLSLLAGRAMAAPDAAAALAELTAKNMAHVSSALTDFETRLSATASTRASHILSVRNLAYTGHQVSINEVAVLQKTDGGEIVKLFEALCDYGDKAALASSQAAAAQAAAKAEIAASYTPLKISTEKLDRAAKSMASLSKEQTDAERAKFLVQFLKDTRDETKRLLEGSEKAEKKGDALLKDKAQQVSATDPGQIKK